MPRHSRRSLLIALLTVAALAGVLFGVSGGIAAGRGTATPASVQRPKTPAETIQQCLAKLTSLRSHAAILRKMRQDVVAKRSYLYTVGHFSGHTIFAPLSVSEFTYLLTEELVLGKITAQGVAKAVRAMKRTTASNLIELNGYIAAADRAVQSQRRRCASLGSPTTTTTAKPPPPSATTFTLQQSLTKVTNTHTPELTIDAQGMAAVDNHCCDGGAWKVDYAWKVPQTVTPGKTIEITIGIKFESVNPSQPLGMQIGALAPDFAQAVQAHWPDSPTVSKTYTVPIAADQKDSSDIAITIGFVSSGVVYHYRK
jgi:hypothetical protein